MADTTGESGVSGRFESRAPGEGKVQTPPPPPRPPMSNRSPAPISAPTPPPAVITASRSLWVTSFVVGFLAIGVAFLARVSQVDELQELIGDLMPGESEDTVERASAIVYWACVGAIMLVIVLEALLLRLVSNRRRGIRWAMLLFLFAHTGVAVVADAFLAIGDAGIYVRLLLAAQLLLAVLAAIVALLPGSGRWLRGGH